MNTFTFYITGETIMNMARERYKDSADVQEGVKVLTTALIGFKEEDAFEIVMGRKKLCGDCNEGVYMEDDNTEVRPYRFLVPNQPNEVICGWINQEGEIYGHDSYNGSNNHYLLADAIAGSGMVKWNSLGNPEAALENQGWVKFSPYDVFAFIAPSKITDAQRVSLLTWMSCNGIQGFKLHGRFFTYSQLRSMDLLSFAMKISVRYER